MFDKVFGSMVRPETLRSWLRKENIYKWISIAKSATPEGIMKIVPLRKQYLFVMHSKTRRQDLIKSTHLKKVFVNSATTGKKWKPEATCFPKYK